MNNRTKTYLWLIGILIFILFVIIYPLQYDFIEQIKAKKYADWVVGFCTIIITTGHVFHLIKGRLFKHYKRDLIRILKEMAPLVLFYMIVLRGFFGFGIVCINSIYAKKEIVKGTIVNKVQIKGSGKFVGKYELVVSANGKEYIFDSNLKAIENYKQGDLFELEMKKGILNLLYY